MRYYRLIEYDGTPEAVTSTLGNSQVNQFGKCPTVGLKITEVYAGSEPLLTPEEALKEKNAAFVRAFLESDGGVA